jgi:hypothetical protein
MEKYIILAILFILLSPGILLNIPSIQGKWWMTEKTSYICVFVHMILFVIIYKCIMNMDIQEDFEKEKKKKKTLPRSKIGKPCPRFCPITFGLGVYNSQGKCVC